MQSLDDEYDASLAVSIYRRFRVKAGSDRIASEFSLRHLAKLIRTTRPKSALEIGAGIGTITQLILDHEAQVPRLVSIEGETSCRKALAANLIVRRNRNWKLLASPEELPPDMAFDLIVFDGNQYDDCVFDLVRPQTACFVDGVRSRTRNELMLFCARRGMSLEFQQFTGSWRLMLKAGRKLPGIPRVELRRDRCHFGICQAPEAPAMQPRVSEPAAIADIAGSP